MNLTKSLFIGAISYASYAQAAVAAIKDESAEQKYANGLTAAKGALTTWIADTTNNKAAIDKTDPKVSVDKTAFIAVESEKVADKTTSTTNIWTVNYCYGASITDCKGKKFITVTASTDKDLKTTITSVV
eukprot:UN10370